MADGQKNGFVMLNRIGTLCFVARCLTQHDGLRAFAVLSVVLYHAFPNVVRGGYVGVDVFFVISGFLISSILFTELDEHSFSFTTFYGGASGASSRRLLFACSPCWSMASFP